MDFDVVKSSHSVATRHRLTSRLMALAGVVLASVSLAPAAWALSISEAYIFSDWSAPTNVSAAPFTLNATSGYQLTLDSSGVATSATALSSTTAVQITDRFYYQGNSGTIDANESFSGTLADRVNSELRVLDDVGLVNESVDAALNIDFTSGANVWLRASSTAVSVPGLVIFEDAGLDPFSLRYCSSGTCTMLFNGFKASTLSTLTADPNQFGTDDYAPGIDQAFLFLFDEQVTGGFFKFGDTSNLNGERLEIDYVGIPQGTARVSEPSTLLLIGSGLVGLTLLRRFRRK